MNDYHQLELLFGAYFHQDWMHEYETKEQAVKEFILGNPIEDVRKTLSELLRLKNETVPEDLPVKLWKFGSYHYSLVPGYELLYFSDQRDPRKARDDYVRDAWNWLDELCTQFEVALART